MNEKWVNGPVWVLVVRNGLLPSYEVVNGYISVSAGADTPTLELCTQLVQKYEPTDEGKAQVTMLIPYFPESSDKDSLFTYVHLWSKSREKTNTACNPQNLK